MFPMARLHEALVPDIKQSVSVQQIFAQHLASTRLSAMSGETKMRKKGLLVKEIEKHGVNHSALGKHLNRESSGGCGCTEKEGDGTRGSRKVPGRGDIRALKEFSE